MSMYCVVAIESSINGMVLITTLSLRYDHQGSSLIGYLALINHTQRTIEPE